MLPRSLARPLRQLASIGSQNTCAVCKCSCGRTFRPNVFSTQQRRSYEPRPNATSPYARTLERKKYKKELEEYEATRHHNGLLTLKKEGLLATSVDNALEFLNGFAELAETQRGRRGVGVDVETFGQLRQDFRIAPMDCFVCSNMLLMDYKTEHKLLGKKLMYTLSHWGDGQATITIMYETLLQAKNRPSVLKSSELVDVRKQLSEIAKTGKGFAPKEFFVPMVLEGKVEYASGNVDYAIELWTKCIDGAVALSEAHRAKKEVEMLNPTADALYTPWVELTNACLLQGDLEKAKWAIEVGCGQDDPTSHYSAALLEKKNNENGEHVATSRWLYHMTKAGGAGHVRAAHALGNWYGSSGWKYIEDEPPDYIKPTPFDSYPPDATSGSALTSFWNHLGTAVGVRPPPEQDQQHRLFLSAAFPSSPYARFRMAMQWLEVSMGTMYAPSYLIAARLLLEETLWPLAAAPQEALELSDKRYTYASRSDYEAGKRIRRPPDERDNEEQEIPNPGYDPDRAKDLIREVFYAVQAVAGARRLLANAAKGRSRGKNMSTFDADTALEESSLPANWSGNIRKWFRFPETREMYMDDFAGTLYDDELKVDLDVTARQICDEQKWDIYDEEGGLMYKCVECFEIKAEC